MQIEEEIRNLLKKELGIDVELGDEDKSFFGAPFYLAPRDLLYIFSALEQFYNIKFNERQIENYGFLCFKNIVNSVKEIRQV